ncbi:MAG: prephenate dehydrogenase/arogenate dehydrogenase family protein [Puniceicoccales bacterium]|nr:prephenate dehydrogenase/arogenate dehydrogenase family protein [Puniceicoccales bacterium]
MFRQIAILGPGLLGASIMQAARQRGLAQRLTTWSRRAETRLRCEGKPWCDAVFADASDCVRGADLVVTCVPVDRIAEVLAAVAPALEPGTLVTDVGSTKGEICRHAQTAAGSKVNFIGAHPMAGSEKSGLEHASPSLFENRICFLTPMPATPAAAVDAVARFWNALGMQIVTTTPDMHDEIVAHISHLPHLLAATLSATLQRKPEDWRNYAGPGLRDTTRVSGGDPALWCSIVKDNREEILRALDSFQEELDLMRSALRNKNFVALQNQLTRGKGWRDLLVTRETEKNQP